MSGKLNFKAQFAAFKANSEEWIDNDNYFFWDWFCSDKALKIKSKLLMTKAAKVMEKLKLDPEKYYVSFKNNCPVNGKLYDSFQICTYDEKQDVVIWCAPSLGYKSKEGMAELVDFREKAENEMEAKTLSAWSWKELTHMLTADSNPQEATDSVSEELLSGQVYVNNLS
jgi:hypothetical protein